MLKSNNHSAGDLNSLQKDGKISDQLIWNSFRDGNRKAFQHIYDQNFNALLRYGLKLVPDQSFVEDQIQDFFIYLWKKKENLEIKSSITIYLLWSLRNRIIKSLKAEKRLVSDEGLEMIPDSGADTISVPPALKSAVDSLPYKQREAVYLKYYQNLDGKEIAQIMDITLGTTYNLLSRAMANLRKSVPLISMLIGIVKQWI